MGNVIDFHSHILPGMDDGSASVEESIAMLQLEAEQGITHVIATPHFYARYDTPERFLKRRAQAEAQLRKELTKHKNLPEITMGAEVYFFRGMSDSEFLPLLTIRGKHCILIEMPPAPWSDATYRELEEIWKKRGIIPIVAHIDRYIGPFSAHPVLQRLAELSVFVQANAEFFLKRSTARMAMRMLRADEIQLLGSDCHNMSDRKPNLGEALLRIKRKLGQAAVSGICEYERKILDV